MESCERLLLANRAWAAERIKINAEFFIGRVATQTPEFLWIGCSDSRVPAEEITGSGPGDLFVHRNIANQVVNTDLNVLSIVQYAVEALKVSHIIVCGHYHCGGVKAAMNWHVSGPIEEWLHPLRDLYVLNAAEIESLTNEQSRWDRLVEISVTEQVQNLAQLSIIQRAWDREDRPTLHGWVYDLRTGYLNELVKMPPAVFRDRRAPSPDSRWNPTAAETFHAM